MRKCQELAAALAIEYSEKNKNKRTPQLSISLRDKKQESYTSNYSAGKLSIHANSPLAQAYAICQMGAAAKAGHLADYLGECTPRFAMRPLWLKAANEVGIGNNLSIHLPEFMLAEDAELLAPRLCKRFIECGFNAIIIGTQLCYWEQDSKTPANFSAVKLNALCQQLRDHGLQVILKPNFHLDLTSLSITQSAKEDIFEIFSTLFSNLSVDAVLWESLWQTPAYQEDPKGNEMTDAEIALHEIRILESCLRNNCKLIFYMPSPPNENISSRQARWIVSLLDDMGKNTMLAFNAVCGCPYSDHQPNHPLWEVLRDAPDSSSTPLLPIINFGLIKQGEGLWPIHNFDLLDRFLPRCSRHHFGGVIGLASHVPQAGSMLDCNLWVAGQSLWRNISPILLAETWFKAFKNEENYKFCLDALQSGRNVALKLTSLSTAQGSHPLTSEEAKIFGDQILAALKHLQLQWKKQKSKAAGLKPSLNDYVGFFVKDIKQLLGAFLPTYNIPVSYLIESEEPSASFWNSSLDEPIRGQANSKMEAIFLENRYL